MGRRKRTIQANLQHPDLFAPRGEHLHRLACGLRPGAHQDQHAFGVGRAFVLEELVAASRQGREPLHGVGDDARHGGVKRAHAFAGLKERVGVVGGAADERVLRVQGAGTVGVHQRGGIMDAISSSPSNEMVFSSWEVRNPSKKCRKGTRACSVAA